MNKLNFLPVKLSEEFINEHSDEVNWDIISMYHKLSEEFINEHSDKVNWTHISKYQILSEEFINEHSDEVNWDIISEFQNLSEGFIEHNIKKIHIGLISITQNLSEGFIERNIYNMFDFRYWRYISSGQNLSETFMEKHQDKLVWYSISVYQKLSEAFIEKHRDKLDWNNVSEYQELSETFIERYQDKLDWCLISKYQKLSKEFIEKYKLDIPKDTWMYKDKEYKRNMILKTGLYEIVDDCVIAFKAIKRNYYSVFSFRYLYEIGKVYTAHADYNPENEDSFGLSAWTYEGAKFYYDLGRILKIKVHLDDVACLVYEGHKLRCTKIQIIDEVL